MTIKVVGDKPVEVKIKICEGCGFKLEYNHVDLVPHLTDNENDSIEPTGKYLECPRGKCHFRNLIVKTRY